MDPLPGPHRKGHLHLRPHQGPRGLQKRGGAGGAQRQHHETWIEDLEDVCFLFFEQINFIVFFLNWCTFVCWYFFDCPYFLVKSSAVDPLFVEINHQPVMQTFSVRRVDAASRKTVAFFVFHMGGFHKWWYPKMDVLTIYNGNSYENRWFGGTNILGLNIRSMLGPFFQGHLVRAATASWTRSWPMADWCLGPWMFQGLCSFWGFPKMVIPVF